MALEGAPAGAHRLAIFGLIAILAGELAMTARAIDARRLARLDAGYGVAAAVVLAAGLARVFLCD